nr:uncharacterized protein LOC127347814 [Lolium perenne]
MKRKETGDILLPNSPCPGHQIGRPGRASPVGPWLALAAAPTRRATPWPAPRLRLAVAPRACDWPPRPGPRLAAAPLARAPAAAPASAWPLAHAPAAAPASVPGRRARLCLAAAPALPHPITRWPVLRPPLPGRRARRASPHHALARPAPPRPAPARPTPPNTAPTSSTPPRPFTDASKAATPASDEFVASRLPTLPSSSSERTAPPKFG